jgi:hypothetical protein
MLVDDANLVAKVGHDEQIRGIGRLLARLPDLLGLVPPPPAGTLLLSSLLGLLVDAVLSGAVCSLIGGVVCSLVDAALGAAVGSLVGTVVGALVSEARIRRIGWSQIIPRQIIRRQIIYY